MIIMTCGWKANSFSFLVASTIDNGSLELYQRRIVEVYGQWKISKSLFLPVYLMIYYQKPDVFECKLPSLPSIDAFSTIIHYHK
jgi:hypothetical protein